MRAIKHQFRGRQQVSRTTIERFSRTNKAPRKALRALCGHLVAQLRDKGAPRRTLAWPNRRPAVLSRHGTKVFRKRGLAGPLAIRLPAARFASAGALEHDVIRWNRHHALALCLSMTSAQTRSAFVARENRFPLFRIMR